MAQKTICHICGHKFKEKGEFDARNCPRCDANLDNANAETALFTDRGNFIAKGLIKGNFAGQLTLTNKRIVFVKDSNSGIIVGALFGAIGQAIAMSLTRNGSKAPAHIIERSDIVTAVEGKVALGKFLNITTKDDSLYRLSLQNKRRAEWLENLGTTVAP